MLAFLKLEKFDKIKINNSFNSCNSWLRKSNGWNRIVPIHLFVITKCLSPRCFSSEPSFELRRGLVIEMTSPRLLSRIK